MSSIKSLCVVLLAAALVAVACGSDSGGTGGDGANRPRKEAGDGSSKSGGKDENKEDGKKKNGKGGGEAEDNQPAEGNVIRVRVAGGRVEGVGDEVDVALGEDVSISVRSDTADEVHVHGYDVFDDVAPGEQAKIELTADIPGAFEVELEDAGLLLFELRVQ